MTELIYKGPARNEKEKQQAVRLAALVFQEKDDQGAVDFKRKMVSPEGELLAGDIVVLVGKNNNVNGACFLVERDFYRGSHLIRGIYLSSICIAESDRGKGLSILLMQEAIHECERRGAAFALLIARKAVDHFYTKLLFWGISQYAKIHFNIPTGYVHNKNYQVRPVTQQDLHSMAEVYRSVYAPLYGSATRSENYWSLILWKTGMQHLLFDCFTLNGQVTGYSISSGNMIFEIAAIDGSNYTDMLACLKEKYALSNDFVIHASERHVITEEMVHTDFSVTKRQCSYGGHMARIINPEALAKAGAAELDAGHSGKHTVTVTEEGITIDNGENSFLFPGSPHGFQNTCLLMGVELLSGYGKNGTIVKTQPFNIPLLDHA